jgi:hypothetical protein
VWMKRMRAGAERVQGVKRGRMGEGCGVCGSEDSRRGHMAALMERLGVTSRELDATQLAASVSERVPLRSTIHRMLRETVQLYATRLPIQTLRTVCAALICTYEVLLTSFKHAQPPSVAPLPADEAASVPQPLSGAAARAAAYARDLRMHLLAAVLSCHSGLHAIVEDLPALVRPCTAPGGFRLACTEGGMRHAWMACITARVDADACAACRWKPTPARPHRCRSRTRSASAAGC